MKKSIFAAAVLSLFAIAGVVHADGGKVYICHVTSSDTNPTVLIYVSLDSALSHLAQGDYILPDGQTSCTVTPPPPLPG